MKWDQDLVQQEINQNQRLVLRFLTRADIFRRLKLTSNMIFFEVCHIYFFLQRCVVCTYTIIRAPKSPFPNPLAAKVERKDTQINAARKQQSEFISHGLPLSKVLEKGRRPISLWFFANSLV